MELGLEVMKAIRNALPRRQEARQVVEERQGINDPRADARGVEEVVHDDGDALEFRLVAARHALAVRQAEDQAGGVAVEGVHPGVVGGGEEVVQELQAFEVL